MLPSVGIILCVLLLLSGTNTAPVSDDSIHDDVDWQTIGQQELMTSLNMRLNWKSAKNVIVFVGDGLGFSTLAASRFYKAQKTHSSIPDTIFSWETFEATGLLKTYNTNQQTADSAGTATAMFGGEKTRAGVIGIKQNVQRGNCSAVKDNEIKSFITQGIEEGKWTGIVTNTRITHATPACIYAHSADRNWEANYEVPEEYRDICWDIGKQLIDDDTNKQIRVILGGGRRNFLNASTVDAEYPDKSGVRTDGRNLIQDWQDMKAALGANYAYVDNKEKFDDVDPATTDYLLGLFEPNHMKYETDRKEETANEWQEPSLTDMVRKSLGILERSPDGYLMIVEGGRIDHAHHVSNAYRALEETLAFDEAVQAAISNTDVEDTLIIVTADHSHAFIMSGYTPLYNDILGFVTQHDNSVLLADDGLPFTTLSYTNGPGFYPHRTANNNTIEYKEELFRKNLTDVDTTDKDFQQDSAIPLDYELHAGEDVPVYARGPMSHLFTGQHEQHYIAHAIKYISCVGPEPNICDNPKKPDPPINCPSVAAEASLSLGYAVVTFIMMVYAMFRV